MHQFDAGDRNRRGRGALEAQHRGDSLFPAPMVLLDQIVQVLRRPQLRLGGQQAIGFQLTHRAVRRGIAVQSDRPGSIVLAFDRLPKKRLGGRDIALGAQPEVNRPPRPIHGTIEIAPFASNFDVGLVTLHDRPTAWANRFQRFSNSGAYRHTQRIMVVWASDRPRSAIISTRSRRLSLKRRYQRTHRMMTSRSKWRPSNSCSTPISLPMPTPPAARPTS